MFKLNQILRNTLGFGLLVSLVSCGGTTNNDQGVSFLATGFLKSVNGGAYEPSTGSILPLFSDTSLTGYDGLFGEIRIAIQNNLTKQFIRVVRIDCDYEVPGSFIKLPSQSFPASAVILASPPTQQTTTTLTDGTVITSESPNVASSTELGFLVVSPDLYAFINNNKASFPELPFQMTALCSATGVTQAGDVLTTNSLNYFIQFVENAEVGAGNGPGVGVGTGGTLVTTSGTSALVPDSSTASDTSLTSLDATTVDGTSTTDSTVTNSNQILQ